MKKVEMIISYTTDGTDYQYSDNHGILIRCKDCRFYSPLMYICGKNSGGWKPNDFCSKGERKDETD